MNLSDSTSNNAENDFDVFINKIPKEVADSFNNQQVDALRKAVSHESWNNHAIDLRDSIGIFNWRYYFVFVSGRDKRDSPTRHHKIIGAVKVLLFISYLVSSTLLGLFALYLLKSAYGINLFDGYSSGIWHWFKELTCTK